MIRSGKMSERPRRKAAVLVLAVLLTPVVLGVIAFSVDMGYVVLVRTQLQVAADSAAMAAAGSMGLPRDEMLAIARQYAGSHSAGGKPIQLQDADVEYGTWDASTRTFTASTTPGNCIRVVVRGTDPLFFGRIFGKSSFEAEASAIAMCNPRDIAFVVDLSGSMNDDSEPCWATDEINLTFAPQGYPTVGAELMQQLYNDFGYGTFPGTLRSIGATFNVADNGQCFANLTKNNGPLSQSNIPKEYRIGTNDTEPQRKRKAYSYIMDVLMPRVMPAAQPTPNSATNYSYWEKYLDFVIRRTKVSGRGYLPDPHSGYRLEDYNNPNRDTFKSADVDRPHSFCNKIGYRTYVQFMMDFGRNVKPDGLHYTPLSRHNTSLCAWHYESTAGGTFSFPPREQPTHACRRSIIAALDVVKQRNQSITQSNQRDWVCVIAFDTLSDGGPVVEQALTHDYGAAMRACTRLQAVADNQASTATESGVIVARNHIKPKRDGGQGRSSTNKVIVVLTDGVPNLYSSSSSTISSYISSHPNPDFYSSGNHPKNAVLMQAAQLQAERWSLFPVGVGLGTDYTFMDRVARMGDTANDHGQSPRGSGNPAEYEQRLTEIFAEIINNPKVRLVQ